jgi:GNAT superfamily N-acetyltransferase
MVTATVVAPDRADVLSHTSCRVAHQPVESHPVLISAVTSADTAPVLAMLGRCSSWTLYRRFHGATDGVGYAKQLLTNNNSDAFGAWVDGRCVGLASLHPANDDSAEIGVLVEDAWQRRGVGSALTAALVRRARERQLSSLRAEVLSDNHFVLPGLARIGPTDSSVSWGSHSVRIRLEPKTGEAEVSRCRTRPSCDARSRPWLSGPCRPGTAAGRNNL